MIKHGDGQKITGTDGVIMLRDLVLKTFNKQFEAEVEKHRKLFKIGRDFDFEVPEIRALSEGAGDVYYERIDNLASCSDLYYEYCRFFSPKRRDAAIERFFINTARVLSVIHSELKMNDRPWQPPLRMSDIYRKFEVDSREGPRFQHVLLHGDFGFSNICYVEPDIRTIVVIDPSPNRYISTFCNESGPFYLDLSKLTLCLRGTVGLRRAPLINRCKAGVLRRKVIESYADASSIVVDETILEAFEAAVFAAKMREWRVNTALRYISAFSLFGISTGMKIGRASLARQ